jgi:organic radical activating enzyme
MPNILVTNVCNRSCPYCFAREAMDSSEREDRFISKENISRIMNWLKKSNYQIFSVIGGEPTLYPELTSVLQTALDEGFFAFVYTNGLMSEPVARYISLQDDNKVGALINVNNRESYSNTEYARLNRTLSLLGQKAALGYNIHALDFDIRPLAELAVQHNNKITIRLGLAQPIMGGKNVFVEVSQYHKIAERIVEQATACDQLGIRVGFDCGFVLCMFTKEQLGELMMCRAEIQFVCQPVLDIGPQMDTWACFPLSEWDKVRIEDFSSVAEVEAYFLSRQRMYKRSGIFKQCFDCRYGERGQCSGGCLAHVIPSFQQLPGKTEGTPIARL